MGRQCGKALKTGVTDSGAGTDAASVVARRHLCNVHMIEPKPPFPR
jgi:hypothetical protein